MKYWSEHETERGERDHLRFLRDGTAIVFRWKAETNRTLSAIGYEYLYGGFEDERSSDHRKWPPLLSWKPFLGATLPRGLTSSVPINLALHEDFTTCIAGIFHLLGLMSSIAALHQHASSFLLA